MSMIEVGGLRYFSFDTFSSGEVTQGVFSRRGGVSPQPWSSLNLGGTVGDERKHVVENRRRIYAAINRPVESIFDVWQVHSDVVLTTNKPRPLDQPHTQADAIITNNPEITLFMRFADCVPVLLYDPVTKVVGMVHSGWMGTVAKIVSLTVKEMGAVYGSKPRDILAGIGPSIGVDHYEVGPEVEEKIHRTFGTGAEALLQPGQRRSHLDLWGAIRMTLEEAGVEKIESSGICTACHIEDWYSHRAEHGQTGRFGALIALNRGSDE